MALYQSFSIDYIKVRSASKVFSWIDFVFRTHTNALYRKTFWL